MSDDALLVRQAELQRNAATFVRELGLIEMLARAGRVLKLGSAGRCTSLHYANDHEERRHYFVMRIEGWKVDVSLWFAGLPPAVEAFQEALPARLTQDSRLAILRLKDFWHRRPHYPEIVSAWEIYDAVLNHEVRTLDELDAFLAARGLPTRSCSGYAGDGGDSR